MTSPRKRAGNRQLSPQPNQASRARLLVETLRQKRVYPESHGQPSVVVNVVTRFLWCFQRYCSVFLLLRDYTGRRAADRATAQGAAFRVYRRGKEQGKNKDRGCLRARNPLHASGAVRRRIVEPLGRGSGSAFRNLADA
jgi:hypothetical protein